METIISGLISNYGIPGLILAFLIWQHYQNKQYNKNNANKEDLKTVQDNIKTNLNGQIDNINSYIKHEREVLKEMIGITETKIDDLRDHVEGKISNLEDKIDNMEDRIDEQPMNMIDIMQTRAAIMKEEHDKMFDKQIELGSEIHDILNLYRASINSDHIFLGSFHNGTSSLSGVPYYKFDLIAERFSPDRINRDVEFAHMYYNADLMKHGKLPITLIQNNKVHYIIDENGKSELSEIDDIIYRRMRGRDIKQIALHLLRDKMGKPSGFVGAVKYDYKELNIDELSNCAKALEKIYG